ncbi:MAG: helix-turn-helix transcriptional regulator [Mucilaginibacter sp.]|nr:helix-turn-helix transcriptional regulator [Mucilaginibacter sp.]
MAHTLGICFNPLTIEVSQIMNELSKRTANKSVGKSIRILRHQHGWSQEDIATRLGISIPAFSKIETGVTDVNLSRLEQIANIYEVSVVQLLTVDNEQAEPVPSHLNVIQKKLTDRESEIANLQRKVIELYEELRNKSSIAV